jgi:predicted Zn-dependent protease
MNLSHFINNLNLPVDWVGVREVSQNITVFTARDEKSERYVSGFDQGWMVEVLVNGQFAAVATNTPTFKALETAAQEARKIAEQASRYKIHSFDTTVRPAFKGTYQSPDSSAVSLKELSEALIQSTYDLKVNEAIISSTASGTISQTQTRFVSTNGADITQNVTRKGLSLSATAELNGETQTRTNGDFFTQHEANIFNPSMLKSEAYRIGHEAIELTKAENCPSGVFDIILMPDQVYIQVHESIGHPLELDRILGDERNYAGWSFVEPKDFGKLQYGSPLLNITFDPTVVGEMASYNFDDLGAAAERQYLIQDGRLIRGLGSLESQKRLKIPGVASSRASSWNRLPIDRMANLNMEPGHTSFEEMVSQIEDGILMMTNKSWSIDDYRRKFQFSCEYGRRIQNGKLTSVVKNPSYRGITLPFWHKLKAVGNKDTFKALGASNCGKGEPNQLAAVGHAVPACLFEKIDVFGGI